MSYATRLATDLRNAYEDHDRDRFEAALARMVRTMVYTGPTALYVPTEGDMADLQLRMAQETRERASGALSAPMDLPKPPPPLCETSIPHPPGAIEQPQCARNDAYPCACYSQHARAVCMYRRGNTPGA